MTASSYWRMLVARMVELPGVTEAPSQWSDAPALWLDRREIATLEGDWLDLRLTRKGISARRAELKANPRAQLRKSAGDWVMIRLENDDDIALSIELCEAAVKANRRH